MFRFADPLAFWSFALVPALLALYWHGRRRRRALLDRFGEHPLVRQLHPAAHEAARRWKAGLVVAAAAALGLALARPQFGTRVETARRQGQDIVVALDVSRSMHATDVRPSRLERAKLEVGRMIGRLDGDRIGLVAFAGDAFVQSPLTTDYGAAMMFLAAMDAEMMSVQGTDLGRAVEAAVEALEETPPANRIAVLVSDGEDHEGGLAQAIQMAADAEVTVHAVGIGSPGGVPLPDVDERGRGRGFRRDAAGEVIVTALNETALQDIALQTRGQYYRAGPGGDGMRRLLEGIGSGGRELESRQVTQYEEQFRLFLGTALVLLALEALLPERRRRTIRRTEGAS